MAIRNGGGGGGSSPFIADFPSFRTNTTTSTIGNGAGQLGYMSWGGCQDSHTMNGLWDGRIMHLDGITSGEPVLLHKMGRSQSPGARSVAIAPIGNFFVSGQATMYSDGGAGGGYDQALACGIRSSVKSLPPGFNHTTAIVGGHGVNGTLMLLGDLMLSLSGKSRVDPYAADNYMLSHLGYWTDNGAYYYGANHPGFNDSEQALKAVKQDLNKREIPVRYFQWDDWWMESDGDTPGMTSWTPKQTVFPSGFTDWLGTPLSMYAPMYSARNVWINDYTWKHDVGTSAVGGSPADSPASVIPLDPAFYLDLFRNGSKIGMKMFEQDFLCTTNSETSLTNNDITSGHAWMQGMNLAAKATNMSLQWCMMNPMHVLASTQFSQMTNGRATGDNTRSNNRGILSMGQNGLLFYPMGFLASRDNVWTTSPEIVQPNCTHNPAHVPCFERNRHADNAVAVLSSGPYGISDGYGFSDRDVVMHSCRTDGVLLKPGWPLSSIEATFTAAPSDPLSGANVWAAHDTFGPWRWSYLVAVNLNTSDATIRTSDLGWPPQSSSASSSIKSPAAPAPPAAVWQVILGSDTANNVTLLGPTDDFKLPASPPSDGGLGLVQFSFAPVLPNGMSILGDVGKWASASSRRFGDVNTSVKPFVSMTVLGAVGEQISISFWSTYWDRPSPQVAVCNFSASSGAKCWNRGGSSGANDDFDCMLVLKCSALTCVCTS